MSLHPDQATRDIVDSSATSIGRSLPSRQVPATLFATRTARRSTGARRAAPAVASLLALAAVALLAPPLGAAPQVQTPGFYITTIGPTLDEVRKDPFTPDGHFNGLRRSSAFAFADDADVVFVAEKGGNVRAIVDGVLQREPVVDMRAQTATWVDRGLGGIDVHPDFPRVKEILITYTHDNGVTAETGPKYAKVARLRLREEIGADGHRRYFGAPPTAADVIVGTLSATARFPSCNDRPLGSDCGAVDEGSHSFTFVRYGPDGKIYIGTGDGAGFYAPDPKAFYAQVPEHLAGKILRVDPDGTGPADNPFFTGDPRDNASKVWARGLRNPKSVGFHPRTGQLCVSNVGWYLNEGIYCLAPGDNAGWPCRENGPARNGYETLALDRDGERLASCPLRPGEWVEPAFAYPHQPVEIGGETLSVGAVIGCAIADADEYPDGFHGSCVYGDYVFDTLSSVRLDGGEGNPSSTLQVASAGFPTDVEIDPEGRVCWIAYEVGEVDGTPMSEIRCLRHDAAGTVAQYPVVSFDSSPDADSPLAINLDASDSYHTAGLPLVHRWDFGDGNTGTGVSVRHVYAVHGDYTVTLTASAPGENVRRSTSQVIRLIDPTRIPPVLPVVELVEYGEEEHFVSSEVAFGVRIRNDRGSEPFHVLANIYDEAGHQVAHLVEPELVELTAGQSTTVDFLWPNAGGIGEYTIGVEFYAADWGSWTLKYLGASHFLVRTRVSAAAEQAGGGPTSDDPTPPSSGTPDVAPVPGEPAVAEDATDEPDAAPPDATVAETDAGTQPRYLGAANGAGPLVLFLLALGRALAIRRCPRDTAS